MVVLTIVERWRLEAERLVVYVTEGFVWDARVVLIATVGRSILRAIEAMLLLVARNNWGTVVESGQGEPSNQYSHRYSLQSRSRATVVTGSFLVGSLLAIGFS